MKPARRHDHSQPRPDQHRSTMQGGGVHRVVERLPSRRQRNRLGFSENPANLSLEAVGQRLTLSPSTIRAHLRDTLPIQSP